MTKQSTSTIQNDAMSSFETLFPILQWCLPYHKARVKFVTLFVLALIKTPTVNFVKIALSLNPTCTHSSNYRRIQRFMAEFPLDCRVIGAIVWHLMPSRDHLVVSIDRTEWQSGTQWINILMAGIVHDGVAYLIVWFTIPGRRPSNTCERIRLIKLLLDIVPAASIEALVADREFVGHDWFRWLSSKHIPFYIRFKKDALVASKGRLTQVHRLFTHLDLDTALRLGHQRSVHGNRLWVTGMRLKDDYLLIASNQDNLEAISFYRQRWGIETLFGCLKTRGFDLEATHLREPERVAKLVGLLALAFSWTHKAGRWIALHEPININKHGRLAKSLFRTGLDHMHMLMMHFECKDTRKQFKELVKLLKPPKYAVFSLFSTG